MPAVFVCVNKGDGIDVRKVNRRVLLCKTGKFKIQGLPTSGKVKSLDGILISGLTAFFGQYNIYGVAFVADVAEVFRAFDFKGEFVKAVCVYGFVKVK